MARIDRTLTLAVAAFLLLGFARCNPQTGGEGETCDPADPTCGDGFVCETLLSGESRCVSPLRLQGRVLDLADDSPISDARVQAVDVNGAAIGTSGVTAEDGTYSLTVPGLRDEDGTPIDGSFTLRVQAQGYQEFPTAIRPALPIDAATAALGDDGWVLDSPLTTVKLIALRTDTSVLGSIAGAIVAERSAGILVVAESGGSALTGFSDSDGQYVIFNVPAGSYSVNGYAAGVQLDAQNASVSAGEGITGIDLAESSRPLNTISGNVQIVNAPGGSVTSVVLALESTFDDAAARGTVPPGLRVGEITGAFSLDQVPDGRYVILAAFENDGLVRDPDQSIGGTQIVRVEVPDPATGNTVDVSEGFKVTGALAVVSPGAEAPEEVFTVTPEFEWEDDSSEDGYEIVVFDAFGQQVWSDEIGPVSGSTTVTLTYAGTPLEPGMFYQFRATSFRDTNSGRSLISTTEDLRGVFFYIGNQ